MKILQVEYSIHRSQYEFMVDEHSQTTDTKLENSNSLSFQKYLTMMLTNLIDGAINMICSWREMDTQHWGELGFAPMAGDPSMERVI